MATFRSSEARPGGFPVSAGDWKIDDVVITNSGSFGTCDVPVDLIFMDGFEGSPPPP